MINERVSKLEEQDHYLRRVHGFILDCFFFLELREAKIQQFINLKYGSICTREYALKFMQLSKYIHFMVIDSRAQISKFVFGVLDLVPKSAKLLC